MSRWATDSTFCHLPPSRVPNDKMTQVEAACFPDLVTPLASQKLYIQLRNRILQLWLENPRQQLVASDCIGRLQPPWDSDKQLGINIVTHHITH